MPLTLSLRAKSCLCEESIMLAATSAIIFQRLILP